MPLRQRLIGSGNPSGRTPPPLFKLRGKVAIRQAGKAPSFLSPHLRREGSSSARFLLCPAALFSTSSMHDSNAR